MLCNFTGKLSSGLHYCRMSSSIRHRFLGLFSTKSILSASLSSSCSLQLSSFSPSPSPSSSCFRFAVASSAACLLRHFVRRFWNQTWWREKNYWKLIIKIAPSFKSQNKSLNRAFIRMVYLAFFIATSYGVEIKGREECQEKTEEGLNCLFIFTNGCCVAIPLLELFPATNVYH